MIATANLLERNTMLLMNEPLAKHTTWKVGGTAHFYFQPKDLPDLSDFLRSLPSNESILWLGMGSNLLIRDGGFDGTVIATKGRLSEIELGENNRLWVGAGAPCAHVARYAARLGLCGAAFLAGIPGTMGGALAMNAGAFGDETWDRVLGVQTISRAGVVTRHTPLEYQVSYRQVERPSDEWFTGCELQLKPGDVTAEQVAVRELLEKRSETQPISQASAGSTFRNPEGDYAARLIEATGLKGFSIGGAEVSSKHANFIINTGTATAADIEALIQHIQRVVEDTQGIALQTEVHIVGKPA